MILNLIFQAFNLAVGHWVLLWFLFVVYFFVSRSLRYLQSPFRKQGVPGPFFGAFSSCYRAYYANIRRNWHAKLVELHRTYGPVIWVAPDEISVSEPRLRSALYGFADERKEETFFPKSKSFEIGKFNDDFNFVFETDPAKARLGKYALSHPYSERGLAKLEGNFDTIVDEFMLGFNEHVASTSKPGNFCDWTHYFMFDLATQLVNNFNHGLCRAGYDNYGAIRATRIVFNVVGSLIPISLTRKVTNKAIRKALLNKYLEKLYCWSLCYNKTEAHKTIRINEIADQNPDNLMAKFRIGENKTRRLFQHGNFAEAITNNVFFLYAGAMVASNTLPLTMKYIYSHPEVVSKIRAELEHIPGHVKISDLVHQEGVCALPYLEATILEALRLAPSFGIPLSRAVPSTGCQLDQFFVPPGNNVSMSAWTVNTSTEYFGPDAHQFRPERWIGNHPTEMAKDGSGNPRTMRNYLEAGWITFGAGSRVCIGRHLSMIAFMKFVGEMVRNFELEINKEPYLWYGLIQHSEEMIVTARVIPSSPLIAMKAN